MSKKNFPKTSLSILCLAGGAFASGSSNAFILSDNDASGNHDAYDNDGILGALMPSASVKGVNYARLQPLTGMIGSSSASGDTSTSKTESCYSNCHAVNPAIQCATAGYTLTSCPTGYTLADQCPVSGGGAFYKTCTISCHTESAADQCAELSPPRTITSCATGYTLTDQCTVSGGGSYYASCSCHNDSCATYKTGLINAVATYRALVPSCVDYGDTEGCNTKGLTFGTLGNTVFSDATTTSWAFSGFFRYNTSSSTWTTDFPPTGALVSAMNNYSSCAATEGKVSFGGHFSNCHDNNCDTYLSNSAALKLSTTAVIEGSTMLVDNKGGLIEKIKKLFEVNNAMALCMPAEGYSDYCQCLLDGYTYKPTCSTGYIQDLCDYNSNYWTCVCYSNVSCHTNSYSDKNFTYSSTNTSINAYCKTTSTASTIAASLCENKTNLLSAFSSLETAIATAKSANCVGVGANTYSCYSNFTCHSDTGAMCEADGYYTTITSCTSGKNLCSCSYNGIYKKCSTATCLMSLE